ncbi:glycosyl transferase [Gluconobacter oxydans]|uniref:glycosyltransferase n=1 Tax=Gluconobacter thailandicus TaxID=257438 RepID=UPI0002996078|nr:glycosyltransferase [Gluconobacter oxydans H24]ANQ40294.1 glycosyl transferase [Gluconobacter oxydans]
MIGVTSDQKHPDLTGTASRAAFSGYGHEVTPEERAEWREVMSARAQAAFQRGQEAIQSGRLQDGVFWLERAERMARQSPNVIWALAIAFLNVGRVEDCLKRMERLYGQYGLREAAFLSVVCLVRLNETAEAISRLGAALSKFHILPELGQLATQLAETGELPGWCTASNAGWVDVDASGSIRVSLDGIEVGHGNCGRYTLPEGWQNARRLEVRVGRRHVLGSPIDLQALTRCESLVRATHKGLEGWLWYPSEPEHVPAVILWDERVISVPAFATDVDSDVPLSRPRSFLFDKSFMPKGDCGPLILRDEHGRLLTGAPVDPMVGRLVSASGKLPKSLYPVPVQSWAHRPRVPRVSSGCAVVIPVYRDLAGTTACLRSVLKTVPPDIEIIVVDDATPEPKLAGFLDRLAQDGKITLVRHESNQGFPASANDGMRLAAGRDVILLNSDTLVFSGWIERLRARLAFTDVGTVTPFSNDASILSYPSVDAENAVPEKAEARTLDHLCQALFSQEEACIDLPTGNGFCMAITADCLADTGLFREDLFAQGYGEENDFCLRASAQGYRHFPAPDVYVAHTGSTSFGSSRKALMGRNLEILNALHPGYDAKVAAFIESDPLRNFRQKLDFSRINELRGRRRSILLIQHDAGGGVGRAVRQRAQAFEQQGFLALTLRPTFLGCQLEWSQAQKTDFPNLQFTLPAELSLLAETLSQLRIHRIEWHHLVGHAPCIRTLHEELRVPYDVFVHDHIWFCPRISLLDGNGRYCGEPDVSGCETCVATWGDYLGEDLTVPELVRRSRHELGHAGRLMVPSHDTAQRMERHFPQFSFEPVPLEDDAALLLNVSGQKNIITDRPLRICVVGGLSRWKGYDILLAMADYVKGMSLPVELVLVGHTPDDETLIAAGVKVTGEYREDEVLDLIGEQNADVGFIPSVAPETWCYALGILWKSGLEVLCFDIGAQSERVRRSHCGAVVPLGIPVEFLVGFILRRWGPVS